MRYEKAVSGQLSDPGGVVGGVGRSGACGCIGKLVVLVGKKIPAPMVGV